MNSFEINKIIGAVLGALLFVMAIGFLADAIYAPIVDKGPGYTLAEPEAPAGGNVAVAHGGDDAAGGGAGDAAAPVAAPEPELTLAALLAEASVDKGAKVAKKCAACHTFDEGGAKKTGPNLWEIVGRPVANNEAFGYSDAMIEFAGEHDGWSYDMLAAYVESPKTYVPGNKMAFAGLKKPVDRANLLAYLQSLSADPVPFPTE